MCRPVVICLSSGWPRVTLRQVWNRKAGGLGGGEVGKGEGVSDTRVGGIGSSGGEIVGRAGEEWTKQRCGGSILIPDESEEVKV